jgi:hypothetical protein
VGRGPDGDADAPPVSHAPGDIHSLANLHADGRDHAHCDGDLACHPDAYPHADGWPDDVTDARGHADAVSHFRDDRERGPNSRTDAIASRQERGQPFAAGICPAPSSHGLGPASLREAPKRSSSRDPASLRRSDIGYHH